MISSRPMQTVPTESIPRFVAIEAPTVTLAAQTPPSTTEEKQDVHALLRRLLPHRLLQRIAPLPGANQISDRLSEAETEGELLQQAIALLAARNGHTADPVALLLETLRDPSDTRWREHLVACWAVSRLSLTPEQTDAVAETLNAHLEQSQVSAGERLGERATRGLLRSFGLMLPISIVGAMVALLALTPHPIEIVPLLLIGNLIGSLLSGALIACFTTFLIAPLIVPYTLAADMSRTQRVRAAAANALGRLRLPHSVGTLAHALLDRSLPVSLAAEKALAVTLPSLKTEHYGALGLEATPHLCRALRVKARQILPPFTDEKLVLYLLNGLGKIGDGRALRDVSRLASHGQTVGVRQAAERILPILETRQKERTEREMLLRGTQSPATQPEQLLRPTTSDNVTPPEQLLRAAIED